MNDVLYAGGFRDNLNPRYERVGAVADTRLDLPHYQCPGDDGPPRGGHCDDWIAHPDRTSYDHFGTSYTANRFMVTAVGGGCLKSNSPFLRPISRVPTPARTIYYEENIGRYAWAAKRSPCDLSVVGGLDAGPTRTIRGWHGRDWTFNRSFVDGHAETQKVWIEGTEGYAEHYVVEVLSSYPPPPACAGKSRESKNRPRASVTLADLSAIYRCVIIRGPGWQKDTLPAPMIETDLWHPGQQRGSFAGCISQED